MTLQVFTDDLRVGDSIFQQTPEGSDVPSFIPHFVPNFVVVRVWKMQEGEIEKSSVEEPGPRKVAFKVGEKKFYFDKEVSIPD